MTPCELAAQASAEEAVAQPKDKKKEKGQYDPPEAFMPSADVLKQIETKTAQLAAKIAELRKDPKTHELLPDVEIYLRGARNIVRFKEWYNKASGQWTLDALDAGMKRADQLAQGKSPWTTLEKRNVLRAYRSVIDDTAQPYGVTYPLNYRKDTNKNWRVDIVLHGRGSTLTEISFLNTHNGSKKVSPDQDWVQIDIYGRGNNAYRWSGETDVLEAIRAYFEGERKAKRYDVTDPRHVVLRGFSMGGAGTWHLGLHFPDKWCVMGPGAGFTTTHDYAWKGIKELPDYQERCLRIYDAIDYAENARMVPIVAYSGGDDPQKKAADNIENRLKDLKINNMVHLIKPGVGHKFDPDYFQKANVLWAEYASKKRWDPKNISFVTYTTKYPSCNWIAIMGLEKHYEKASVSADLRDAGTRNATLHITTKNVRELAVFDFADVVIDGMKVSSPPRSTPKDGAARSPTSELLSSFVFYFVKESGKWTSKDSSAAFASMKTAQKKSPGRQGPIDDAFASGFVCVQGTGETWHPATQKFVDAKLDAFKYDWAKHWRGELPITNEYGITPNEIKDKHLILFGDPSSNFLLANILPKLPLKWTKDEIEFAGKKYKSSEHVPVLIFPNPLNPAKYVVLNTGHTWPSADYAKTNAMLYPRLGDYAILRMKGGAAYEVATAGLFDEYWKVEK